MYTQCPDCSTGFRVTAEVLKQAAGKVRCGGCGNAFNALEFLSEKMPQQSGVEQTDAPLAELAPEIDSTDDGLPQSITAEQSAALLKTLDELAGADVRIEDTGVEWRVLDEDETAEDSDDDESSVDELLQDSPTPIDEFLTQSPSIVDESDIFEELRFDDDTPLPDDFDAGDRQSVSLEPDDGAQPEADTEAGSQMEKADVDDEMGESGEWADILDEVDEAPDTGHPPPEEEIDDATNRQQMDDDVGDEPEPLEFGSVDTAIAKLEEQSNVFDEEFFDAGEELEQEEDDIAVAPQTEEEQSLNLQIDEELLNLAVEDEDGFASTIVIAEKDTEQEATAEQEANAEQKQSPVDDAGIPAHESIVMEGELVSSALDEGKREADMAAAALLASEAKAAEGTKQELRFGSDRRRMTGAAIALAALLLLQVVHQSRNALATIPAIDAVVGPVYRAVGKPIAPAWDVTAWRFEATFDDIEGSAQTNDEQLNIYVRIGNQSDKAMPYPLVSASLTDRFEETIGNRVLEPAEYLPDDIDPRARVQAGSNFNATISIRSPAQDATGYKLKVCYRLSAGQLRCKMPTFK